MQWGLGYGQVVRGKAGPDHGSAHSVNLGPPRNRGQHNKDFTRETAQETNGVEVGRRGWESKSASREPSLGSHKEAPWTSASRTRRKTVVCIV